MQKDKLDKQQAKTALQQLRAIEKARLKLKGDDSAVYPSFSDMAVHAVWLISDLAGDTIRRVKAAKRADRKQKR